MLLSVCVCVWEGIVFFEMFVCFFGCAVLPSLLCSKYMFRVSQLKYGFDDLKRLNKLWDRVEVIFLSVCLHLAFCMFFFYQDTASAVVPDWVKANSDPPPPVENEYFANKKR